jgi:hypothetical protein
MEVSAQTGVTTFSSVATRESLQVGGYYLRITRDDMGGLAYLYDPKNEASEGLDSNVTAFASGISTYNPVVIASTNTTTTTTTTTGFTGLFGGVGKITFVKTPFESGVGSTYYPRIYHYSMRLYTNNGLNNVVRTIGMTRTVTQPDIIFTAGDLTSTTQSPPYQETLVRSGAFITTGQPTGVGVNNVYPAVIAPELIVTLNNSGQVTYNDSAFTDQDSNLGLGFIWGSFNGSTNAPIAFLGGGAAGLAELEAEVLSQSSGTEVGVYNPVGINTSTIVVGQ